MRLLSPSANGDARYISAHVLRVVTRAKASRALVGRVPAAGNPGSASPPPGPIRRGAGWGRRGLGVGGHGQAVGPLPSQPRRLNIITSKVIATSSEPMPRNRK